MLQLVLITSPSLYSVIQVTDNQQIDLPHKINFLRFFPFFPKKSFTDRTKKQASDKNNSN
jgi:hypothetical protein